MEIFHSTKESWRCLGGEHQGTFISETASLREKGNSALQNSALMCFRIIFLPFLPSLPSPDLKQALVEVIRSVLDATLQHGQVSFSAVNRRNG